MTWTFVLVVMCLRLGARAINYVVYRAGETVDPARTASAEAEVRALLFEQPDEPISEPGATPAEADAVELEAAEELGALDPAGEEGDAREE